jgi:hypothetical protein
MAELRQQVAHCADGAGAGFGGTASPAAGPAATALVLDVETIQGGLRILGARREGGGAHPAADCAQTVLRGHVIPAPSATPGRQWQMPFALGPS